MGHVIAIFGTLIALNLGFGYWLSEENKESQPDACQVVTQAPPLVTTCFVNRANLRCALGNTLHVSGGRGSQL